MNNNCLPLALGVGLAWAIGRIVASETRRRHAEKELQDEVRKWEDEGGYIPGVRSTAPTAKEVL